MIINKNNHVMCENRNAELLLDGIFRMNPDAQFYIIGDEITEHEALLVYCAVEERVGALYEENMIYVPSISVA